MGSIHVIRYHAQESSIEPYRVVCYVQTVLAVDQSRAKRLVLSFKGALARDIHTLTGHARACGTTTC